MKDPMRNKLILLLNFLVTVIFCFSIANGNLNNDLETIASFLTGINTAGMIVMVAQLAKLRKVRGA